MQINKNDLDCYSRIIFSLVGLHASSSSWLPQSKTLLVSLLGYICQLSSKIISYSPLLQNPTWNIAVIKFHQTHNTKVKDHCFANCSDYSSLKGHRPMTIDYVSLYLIHIFMCLFDIHYYMVNTYVLVKNLNRLTIKWSPKIITFLCISILFIMICQ